MKGRVVIILLFFFEGGKEGLGGREGGGREGWGREGLHVRIALYHHLIGKGVNV